MLENNPLKKRIMDDKKISLVRIPLFPIIYYHRFQKDKAP